MKQQRNTRQRKLVLEVVRSRCDHPSAEQIYEEVHKREPHISRGTVYRNLHLLCDSHSILHVKLPGCDRFDLCTDPHYHVLCSCCGELIDAPKFYFSNLDQQVAASTGYQINCHHLVFEGICPKCQANTSSSSRSGSSECI